jgi:hypothetical protein
VEIQVAFDGGAGGANSILFCNHAGDGSGLRGVSGIMQQWVKV